LTYPPYQLRYCTGGQFNSECKSSVCFYSLHLRSDMNNFTATHCERIFRLLHKNWERWGISVSVVIRLWVARFKAQVQAGAADFGLLQNAQAVSGTHPASYFVGTGALCMM
jgi:hypothetical protein